MTKNVHIVKRNPDFSDDNIFSTKSKTGFISQSALGRKPIGWNSNIGDEVWIHEVGFGITKFGIIKSKSPDVIKIKESNFNELIALYCEKNTNIKDQAYWWELISKMIKKPTNPLYYIEFEIEYTYLSEPIPCTFNFQGGWKTLKEHDVLIFEEDKKKSFLDISLEKKDIESLKNIPTKIKVEIFKKMKLSNMDKLVLDFDHIIPKYVGGLGCFIENVQPLHKAINRSKSKSVPTVLFDVAEEYVSLKKIAIAYKKPYKSKCDFFSQDEHSLNYAKKIMEVTHNWSIQEQKQFYASVLKRYDYNYYNKLFE